MQIKNLSIVLAFLGCAMTTLASPIPNNNDVVDLAEISNDEVSNNNIPAINTNDDAENSAEEVDIILPKLDNAEDSNDESNETPSNVPTQNNEESEEMNFQLKM